MAFQKGQSGNPNGRKPGAANKVNKAVKEAILEALNDGTGAVAFFKKLKTGTNEDRRTFANVCARLIPSEITGAGGRPLIPSEPDMLEVARSVAFMLNRAEEALTGAGDGKPDSIALPLFDTGGQLAPVKTDMLRGLNGDAGSKPLNNGHDGILVDGERLPGEKG